tara:strand:- start:1104 stop:1343 length:240 start_codon:yes stop_codon:yes gene_type:complete
MLRFKNKNSQTLIMEKFHQITLARLKIVTSSMKPETYLAKEKSKNKKLLILDKRSSTLEPTNRLSNLAFLNIVHQLLKD